jgi:ketosteroid isomerase-like protein
MRLQMRRNTPRLIALALALLVLTCGLAHAGTQDETAIRGVLNAQVADWNRGDVVAFMRGYNDSPSTTFIGKTIQHGYANILARYQKSFAGKEEMGQLTFSDLEVHRLDAHFATVTGHYHLARSAAGGGDAAGIFSLVFEKTHSGWKIILDHTS